MAQFNFDATQFNPSTAMDPLPADWYLVQIVDSEFKETQMKNGTYLALTFEVLQGPYAGRKVFTNLNLVNENTATVEIAYKNLSAICHCIGRLQFQDTSQLPGIPLQVKVAVQLDENKKPKSNDVKGYRDANGNDPGQQGAVAPQGQPMAGAAGGFQGQPPAAPMGSPGMGTAPNQGMAPQGGQVVPPGMQQQTQQPPFQQQAAVSQPPFQQNAPAQPMGAPVQQQTTVQPPAGQPTPQQAMGSPAGAGQPTPPWVQQ